MHSWHRAPATLRGFTPKDAPFIHAFWRSPEVQKIMEEAVGIELEFALPYEIGHTNIQLGVGGKEGVQNFPLFPEPVPAGWEEQKTAYHEVNVDDWHTDSFPYVCVLMLSNTDKIVGGETALRMPDGMLRKLRGPTMSGSCLVMQGRHMPHAALRAWNTGADHHDMLLQAEVSSSTRRHGDHQLHRAELSESSELVALFLSPDTFLHLKPRFSWTVQHSRCTKANIQRNVEFLLASGSQYESCVAIGDGLSVFRVVILLGLRGLRRLGL
jgi:hypothetical protein